MARPGGYICLHAEMTAKKPTDARPTDARRKRILYRATHRGTKESDAIVGGFFTGAAAGQVDRASGRWDRDVRRRLVGEQAQPVHHGLESRAPGHDRGRPAGLRGTVPDGLEVHAVS